ncbi:MAG: carbon-nitrogen hydrolase [Chloroflexi bacterium]|nr:carbon-nitrogen hydrolase [Chloroflexota bacterium]
MSISVTENDTNPDLSIEAINSYGQDLGRGNMIGVQTYMGASDYASAKQFYARLDGYLDTAEQEGWLRPNSVVIFPEYIGTWLVVAGEHESILQADRLESGMKRLIGRCLPRFLLTLPRSKGDDKIIDTLFRMKAKKMSRIYQETFAQLSRHYQVTIVAGSIVLPHPQIEDGELVVSDGRLQNIACVFGSDGRIHPHITRKVYPVAKEISFLAAADATDLPVYETPAGRLGVLICADSWYPATYATLAEKDVQLIAVPNNQGHWQEPWPGYATEFVPADVDGRDTGQLTEREAWLKYALAGRMHTTGAAAGMHVFFHGRLWDQIGNGQTILMNGNKLLEAPYVEKAALVNMWL